MPAASPPCLSRRAFLQGSALCLAGLGQQAWAEPADQPVFRAGLVTDLHYADKPPGKTRCYRETLGKLEEAVARFNTAGINLAVELGDFIDKAPENNVELELAWLRAVEGVYAKVQAPRHYVLGNHCTETLTKGEFAAHTAASPAPHYAWLAGGLQWLVLDACFTEMGEPYGRGNFDWRDANIPEAQISWLKQELAKNKAPAVVFVHQRLDENKHHSVRNRDAVRQVLEESKKVLAVFQGHSHANDYQQIGGIHYCTLVAMVEGSGPEQSGYGVLEVMPDGALRLQGFRRQLARAWPARRTA